MSDMKTFFKTHYRHFNAASLVDAAKGYCDQIEKGNKMLISLAGAMSTAELGVSLAEMIRQEKVHIISCTGANLEEDIMNLIAYTHYKRIPNYRDLSPDDEQKLLEEGFNRVTDTCIPEETAFRKLQIYLFRVWQRAESEGKRYFPHEFLYQVIAEPDFAKEFEIDPKDSWVYAAAKKNLPIIVPGWEDSTTANIFTSYCISGELSSQTVKNGIEYMMYLAKWYPEAAKDQGVGFFQIGGGIAGDFPICVVPMINQDMEDSVPLWSYFCQISDSTTSYGSYSGAIPNEKITWGKLGVNTPRFLIESDATIVAPLIFSYILEN
ncbi:MAG: deoxyhypusine synthase family protein [Bacteriovoracaceae bacterium]|nr:deoxyhypusine synthase family protein [Bacteriovoracaceae bacterium]